MPVEPDIEGVGKVCTETTKAEEVNGVHPEPSLAVTVYEPALLTVILLVVAPLLQVFPDAADDVKVMLSPWHSIPLPVDVMVGAVVGVARTVTLSEELQPSASVTVNR